MKKKNKRYPRGSNMTFRTEVFSSCGHFNVALGRVKRILLGGEEKDIAFRILDQKKGIAYIPEAIVYHLVPEHRTTTDFIQEQALGTGRSEQIRSKANHEYPKRLIIECIKWGATFVLWFWYTLTCRMAKANMLVRFRYWVSQGLIQKLPQE
jgi:GT2 family glycosyltransferase